MPELMERDQMHAAIRANLDAAERTLRRTTWLLVLIAAITLATLAVLVLRLSLVRGG